MDNGLPQLLKAAEVAKMLRVSLPAVYKWTRQGVLSSYRFEKSIRYSREDVEEFINQHRERKSEQR